MDNDFNEAKLHRFLERGGDLFAVAEPEGRLVYTNRRWEDLLGWTPADTGGRPFLDFVHPDDRERTAAAARELARAGRDHLRFENRVLSKRDDVHWLQWESRFDESGLIFAVARDVTEQRRLRARLEASDEHLRLLGEHLEEAFWISDADKQRMLYVSPGFERIVGTRTDRIYEDPLAWTEHIHPDDHPRYEAEKRRFENEGVFDVELRLVGPGREVRWIRDQAFPVRHDGQVVHLVGVMQDVTDRREMEASRLQLLHTISHDLVGPLQPLMAQLELLRDKTEADVQRNLDIMERNVGHMARLVADVSDVLQMEQAAVRLRLERVDLCRLLHDVSGMYDGDPRHIVVEAPGPVEADVDAHRMTRVVSNLVRNACKFTPAGGTVTLRCNLVRDRARISVADTGRGIDPGEIDQLFQPFSQLASSGEVQERGTGLGLFICKSIVEAHGGRIWAESPGRGHGSTFHAEVPLE